MKDKELYGVLDGYYEVAETIGCGGFAKVKKATHLVTGERVAIKILDKVSLGDDLPRVTREIDTLKTLNHPHITKLFQVIETQEKIFMVMEICRGGELFDYIVQRDRLEENEARKFFRQIASAVAYIHARGIAHRDLKPENILLDESNNVKLIDFGLCSVPVGGANSHLETCCGSPAYAAPELIMGEKYMGPLADVWSLGVLLYALLNGFLPFDDPNLGVLYKKIKDGKYEEPKYLSEGAKSILRCMLQVNPKYRLSVNQLLNHTWCQHGKPETLPEVDPTPYDPSLENDILHKMSFSLGTPLQFLQDKLGRWDYVTYDTSTYLILANRKHRYGVQIFRKMPMRLERAPPQSCSRSLVQKSLDGDLSDADSVDAEAGKHHHLPATPARPYHASMEGGLDDANLLLIGSPKIKEMENTDADEFLLPPLPTPKKPKHDATSLMNNLSPARSADSVLQESANFKTPIREKWRNMATPVKNSASPAAKRNMLGSIERGLDRFRLMLTPKTGRDKKKIRRIRYCNVNSSNKGAFNVSATASRDPDFVIAELKASLAKIGIISEQKGYCLTGKWVAGNGKPVKFELEVVAFEALDTIGIRRKRQNGDSWSYKQIIEQVLALTGVCQLPVKKPAAVVEPLQTTV